MRFPDVQKSNFRIQRISVCVFVSLRSLLTFADQVSNGTLTGVRWEGASGVRLPDKKSEGFWYVFSHLSLHKSNHSFVVLSQLSAMGSGRRLGIRLSSKNAPDLWCVFLLLCVPDT